MGLNTYVITYVIRYGSNAGDINNKIANPPSPQRRTGFLGGQPSTIQTFRPCQCRHAAQAISASVSTANIGRYGSIAIKAEAEPKPRNTTSNGPMQQADARPPVTMAAINDVFSLFVSMLFKLDPPMILK